MVENTQKMDINADSGTLVKTYKDSFFKLVDDDESLHFYLREDKPSRIIERSFNTLIGEKVEKHGSKCYRLKDIVILQVMLCSDGNYLVEAIDKDIFDEMYEKPILDTKEQE